MASNILGLCLVAVLAAGCALTSKATDFNGVGVPGGDQPIHINTTKYALHFLTRWPLIGDASLNGAVKDFTNAAKLEGATKVRIVQSDETTLWWIFPPFTLILTPKYTNVAGDAMK